ncbi:hypothetical protein LINPERPRIM_LOCUS9545 [Linum perenne]
MKKTKQKKSAASSKVQDDEEANAGLCVIGYDEKHDSFFVPCEHSAICIACATMMWWFASEISLKRVGGGSFFTRSFEGWFGVASEAVEGEGLGARCEDWWS